MRFVDRQPTTKRSTEQFTGDVWLDPVYSGADPLRGRVNLVRFAPGARTHWHRHALGQTLRVVTGTALVGTRDGVVFEAREGETVECSPNEDHWHGAAPDSFMTHLAIWESDGSGAPETTWLEPVGDAQYAAPRTRPAAR